MSRLPEHVVNKIRKLFKETGSIRKTASLLKVSRNAVRRALRHGPASQAPASKPARPGKLDPYRAKISYLVREKGLSAVRVLEDIRPLGYTGGYSILKDYIRSIRPRRGRGPTISIAHHPGGEGQMDWSPHPVTVGGRDIITHTGSIILCFSRWMHMRFFPDETIERVMALHEDAFQRAEGVPDTMTYDNMTTVGRHMGPGEVWINPRFKAFAKNLGFEVIILPPGAKDRHGMVERPFHYIEQNCLKGREFTDFEHLDTHGQWWLDNRANVRIHGKLRERPIDRLQRERPFLNPLPSHRLESFREVERIVQREFCVVVDTNSYSVHPDHVGKRARVRLYPDHLQIWVDNGLAASHVYKEGKHQRSILPEHEQAFRGSTFQTELLKSAFLRLGGEAGAFFEGLRRERGLGAGYHLQRVLKLSDRYGSNVVAGAMAHAMRFGVYSADGVIRIIHGKALRAKGSPRMETESVPENIRQWLTTCAVEDSDLASFDRMMEELKRDDEDQ